MQTVTTPEDPCPHCGSIFALHDCHAPHPGSRDPIVSVTFDPSCQQWRAVCGCGWTAMTREGAPSREIIILSETHAALCLGGLF